MDVRTSSSGRHREKPPIRLFALLALLVAACLLVWRGMLLLSPPEPTWQASNSAESQLMGILAPLTGAENIRLTVSETGEGARSVVILLAADVEEMTPDVMRVATRSANLDETTGDVLVIETAAFSTHAFSSTTPADMMEIFALGIVCLALGWIIVISAPAQVQMQTAPSLRRSEGDGAPDFLPEIRRERSTVHPDHLPDTEAVARVARRDPAQAAKIIRAWMRQSGGQE